MSNTKSKNSDDFLLRLISLMEKREISKAQLARDLGVSNAHVANWLAGQMPRAEHLLPISRYFKVSMEELLCGEEARASGPGGPGQAPLYNPGHGAKVKIHKSEDLLAKAGEYQAMADRMETDRNELLEIAEFYKEWAQSVLEEEEED